MFNAKEVLLKGEPVPKHIYMYALAGLDFELFLEELPGCEKETLIFLYKMLTAPVPKGISRAVGINSVAADCTMGHMLARNIDIKTVKFNIYVSHSHAAEANFLDGLYKPIRSSSLNSQFAITLPHEKSDSPFLTKEVLGTFSAIVAEVSFKATGQGIELGWADMLGVPIVCIFKEGSKPAKSLATVSKVLLEYRDSEDMIAQISKGLFSLGLC